MSTSAPDVRARPLDLDAYRHRLGLDAGDVEAPTLRALRRVHRAHVDRVPFNSVTTALGRVPALDLPALERKLVIDGRGGYCLEHVRLFTAVLDALGFAPEVRLAAVGPLERTGGPPPTHLTVVAQPADDARRWLADVGFGVGILGPLPLPVDAPGEGQPQRHGRWEHRVDRLADGQVVLLEHVDGDWRVLHSHADREVGDAEIAEANRWVALQPGSPFAGRLVAMRTDDEVRMRLLGATLEITEAGARPRTERLEPVAAVQTLVEHFDTALTDADRDGLVALLSAQEPRP